MTYLCLYRTPQEMLQLLAPMFEMDYLLPWSFVAVLNIERFETAVREKKIPIDVVLAGINNFIRTNSIFKSDKIEIRIMEKITNILKNKREKIRKVKTSIMFFKKYISQHKMYSLRQQP